MLGIGQACLPKLWLQSFKEGSAANRKKGENSLKRDGKIEEAVKMSFGKPCSELSLTNVQLCAFLTHKRTDFLLNVGHLTIKHALKKKFVQKTGFLSP
jgi:hypothetical protein